jgi:arginyl-tRNA synthetase
MNVLALLRTRFADALAAIGVEAADAAALVEMVLPSQDAKFGDYQANCAMPLGKWLGKPPRAIAEQLVAALRVEDVCEPPEVAGPGFINLRLKDSWVVGQLAATVADLERLGVSPAARPRTIVLDFSSPNVAKPMHVGHIRSTVIGDALCRVLRFLGHQVISDNHLGDWGTQFGMIIYGYKHFVDEPALAARPVEELSRLYKLVNSLAADDPEVQQLVLEETARLHSGDPTNVELWRQFLPACLADVNATYERLGVRFDHTLGESFYQDRLRGVVKSLIDKGLARESDGAICVFLDGHDAPMIVQKQDGAFLYATTDLATIQYRLSTWRPDAILYVVDHRQSLHFEKLFATARLWGYRDVELEHIAFGTVLGEDGRPFKTREGTAVGLVGLLDEAVERAYPIVCQNDDERPEPLLSEAERRTVAERIGIGAIKYADLAHNRTSDYVFSYDKMLAMTGNTAAYMQYSYARVKSIFGKAGVGQASIADFGLRIADSADKSAIRNPQSAILLTTSHERALAVALLQFSEALDRVAADYRPNHLTAYLFELASRYSEFFEHCPVLKAESDALRTSRLLLCDLTARTLQRGLNLLGIETVERM